MGLWKLFSKKHKNKRRDTGTEEKIDAGREIKRSIRLNTKSERIGYIQDNCEQVLESERQIAEAKAEYQSVTSYLTDMQKIDLIPLERRGNLEDAARSIFNLTRERNKLQNRSQILSDKQYRLFEQYEPQIPKDLPAIKESENYQAVIQQDLVHLEKERKALDSEEEDINSKQAFLKSIAVIMSIIVIFLFLLFAVLGHFSQGNFTVPFILTVLMGMVTAFYIFMESRKNISDIRIVHLKQNRQIMLMNKVKIKSVNNRNFLDYVYNKYNVESYEQLNTFWVEYVRVKDENRRYQNNTQLLEFYNNELINELRRFGIADCEIWIFQPSAILDSREMVEVRHRLNVRRQSLRERIDINARQKEEAMKAISSTMNAFPDCIEDAEKLLRRYRIDIEK